MSNAWEAPNTAQPPAATAAPATAPATAASNVEENTRRTADRTAEAPPPVNKPTWRRLILRLVQFISCIGALGFLAGATPVSLLALSLSVLLYTHCYKWHLPTRKLVFW